MLYFLCFLSVLILLLLYTRKYLLFYQKEIRLKKEPECNELIKSISPTYLNDGEYKLSKMDGKNLSYDINNLNHPIYFTKINHKYTIENHDKYVYIYTESNPRLYLNVNINGKIKFIPDKYFRGNKWNFLNFNTDDILKELLINEIKYKKYENIVNKYNYIYNNGYFLKSLEYDYFLSDNIICPTLKDIIIVRKIN